MTRALLFQSKLPHYFWGDCLLTSTYIINRLPNSKLEFATPYSKLFDEPPSYTNLKAFGCLAYMSVHSTDKPAARALKTIFIGYPPNKKGYKLFDPVTQTIHISRHVIFDESQFPYSELQDVSTIRFPPPDSSTSVDLDTPVHEIASPDFGSYSSPSVHLSPEGNVHTNQPTPTVQSNSSSIPVVQPRTSLRHKIQPAWMKDYKVSSTTILTNHCASSTTVLQECPVDASKFSFQKYSSVPSTIYSCAVNASVVVKEPYSYNQAICDPPWVEAMSKELKSLKSNNTWTLMPLPPNKKVVGCRWVYRVKYLSNEEIDKFKARLVTKGYTQIEGEDYHNTFAPVAKMVTVRTILSIASTKGWDIH